MVIFMHFFSYAFGCQDQAVKGKSSGQSTYGGGAFYTTVSLTSTSRTQFILYAFNILYVVKMSTRFVFIYILLFVGG